MVITLEQIAELSLLKKAWKAVRGNKSKEVAEHSRGIDEVTLIDFEKRAGTNLDAISEELKKNTYEPKPVKIVLEKKKSGKYRTIAIPSIQDRIVQRALLSLFEPDLMPVINTGVSYCGVKNDEDESINLKNAVEKFIIHVKEGFFWVFESDITEFYDSIDKDKILNKLNSIVDMSSRLSSLLEKYIFFKVGNPEAFPKAGLPTPNPKIGLTQGSALSPILANLFLKDFDLAMKARFGDRFIRYVDDFVVLCDTEEEAKSARDLAKNEIQRIGLRLSPDGEKTHIKNLKNSEKIDFLGLSIHGRGIIPKIGLKGAQEYMRKVIAHPYKNRILRNGKIIGKSEQIVEKIKSWGEHYRFYHVEDLYSRLDEKIGRETQQRKGIKLSKPLNDINLEPIISTKDWISLFQKRKV